MLFFLYFFHVQPLEKWRRKMAKMTFFRFFKMFIAILWQNDASYEKKVKECFRLRMTQKNLNKLVATLKNEIFIICL